MFSGFREELWNIFLVRYYTNLNIDLGGHLGFSINTIKNFLYGILQSLFMCSITFQVFKKKYCFIFPYGPMIIFCPEVEAILDLRLAKQNLSKLCKSYLVEVQWFTKIFGNHSSTFHDLVTQFYFPFCFFSFLQLSLLMWMQCKMPSNWLIRLP